MIKYANVFVHFDTFMKKTLMLQFKMDLIAALLNISLSNLLTTMQYYYIYYIMYYDCYYYNDVFETFFVYNDDFSHVNETLVMLSVPLHNNTSIHVCALLYGIV